MGARFWGDLKTTDFARLSAEGTVAVLPLAAIEQHGPHLPVSVDTTIMNAMLAEAMPLVPAGLECSCCRRWRSASPTSTCIRRAR
jgi:creatinine amidohydrolase